jgi:hypothetical protein
MHIASRIALLLVTFFTGLSASAGGSSPGGSSLQVGSLGSFSGRGSGKNLSGGSGSGSTPGGSGTTSTTSLSGSNGSGSTPGGSGSISDASIAISSGSTPGGDGSATLAFIASAAPGPANAIELHSQLFKFSAATGPEIVVDLRRKLPGNVDNLVALDTDPEDESHRRHRLQTAAASQLTAIDPPLCW